MWMAFSLRELLKTNSTVILKIKITLSDSINNLVKKKNKINTVKRTLFTERL